MRIHRAVWLAFCSSLGVLGLLFAFTWSLTAIIMVFVCGILTSWVVAMIALNPDDTTRLPRNKRRVVAGSAVLTGAGAVAFIGLGTVLGAPIAVLLLAITAGGSPYATSWCVRRLRKHGQLAEPAPQPVPPGPDQRAPESVPLRIVLADADPRPEPREALPLLSDDALCLAWRASFSVLQRAESTAQQLSIVEERRTYLDEIERRNAHGLAAWLASGPRAAGDPGRFVLGDGAASGARIDWDELLHDTGQ